MRHMARELDKELSGGFFDKAQQVGPQEFKLSFRTKNGRRDVLVRLPGLVNLTEYKIPSPKKPSNFVMMLRKNLSGKKLVKVTQHDSDRILVFDFGNKKLVLELFSHGNMILLEDSLIKLVFRSEEWRDRKIKPGKEYIFPKKEADPESEHFEQYLQLHGEPGLAKAVGKETAKLLLEYLSIPAGLKKYSAEHAEKIANALKSVLNAETKPVKQNGILLPVKIGEKEVEKGYPTASKAVEEEFPPNNLFLPEQDNKLERILKKQKQTLEEYQHKAEEEKRIADTMLEKQHIINKAIQLFKDKKYSELEKLNARKTKDGKIEIDL